MDFTTILDAAGKDGTPRTKIQIAKISNDFKDPRYGDFGISVDEVKSWAKNLAKMPDGRALIDLDHSPERGSGTEAAGWITSITLENGIPYATVEWTPLGAQAIKDKRYLFISPTFTDHGRNAAGNEKSEDWGPTLEGAGLTNRPFLNMPAISLSRDFKIELATQISDDSEKSSDSRRTMADLDKIAKALGLKEGADEATILDALKEQSEKVTTLTADLDKANEAKPEESEDDTKTLEAKAAEEGKVVLDKSNYESLKAGAEAGSAAKKELDTMKFDTAWNDAVKALTKAPAEKATYEHFYSLDPEKTLEALRDKNAPKIVSANRKGSGETSTVAPEGVQEEAHTLDVRVRAAMKEDGHNDYAKALDKVLATEGAVD